METNNLKTIRELRKVLECTQDLIDDLTPKPNMTQVDYEPQFELGTRYIDSIGHVYRYCKLDAGVVGITNEMNEELRNICYRWI